MTKKKFVLDAWAILALLQGEEPAATRIKELLEEALDQSIELSVSMINLGEVYYRIGKAKGQEQAEKVFIDIQRLPISFISTTDERIIAAAKLIMLHPISYANAFAASASLEKKAILVTGDPELISLEGIIQLEKLNRM